MVSRNSLEASDYAFSAINSLNISLLSYSTIRIMRSQISAPKKFSVSKLSFTPFSLTAGHHFENPSRLSQTSDECSQPSNSFKLSLISPSCHRRPIIHLLWNCCLSLCSLSSIVESLIEKLQHQHGINRHHIDF